MLNDIDIENFKNRIFSNDLQRKRIHRQLNIWELATELGIDLLNYIKQMFPNNILTVKPDDTLCLKQFELMIVKLDEFIILSTMLIKLIKKYQIISILKLHVL